MPELQQNIVDDLASVTTESWRTFRIMAEMVEALDTLNVDHLLDNYADSLGLPVSLTRSLEEREQLRAARAEALRAAAEIGVRLARRLVPLLLAVLGAEGQRHALVLHGLQEMLRVVLAQQHHGAGAGQRQAEHDAGAVRPAQPRPPAGPEPPPLA